MIPQNYTSFSPRVIRAYHSVLLVVRSSLGNNGVGWLSIPKSVKATTTSRLTLSKVMTAKSGGKAATAAKAKAKTTTSKSKTAKTKVPNAVAGIKVPGRAFTYTMVLVAVAVLAVLYAAYEYRHNLRNLFLRIKRD